MIRTPSRLPSSEILLRIETETFLFRRRFTLLHLLPSRLVSRTLPEKPRRDPRRTSTGDSSVGRGEIQSSSFFERRKISFWPLVDKGSQYPSGPLGSSFLSLPGSALGSIETGQIGTTFCPNRRFSSSLRLKMITKRPNSTILRATPGGDWDVPWRPTRSRSPLSTRDRKSVV